MFNARLLGNGRYHGNRQPHHCDHIRDTIGCDHPIFIQMGPLVSELYHFQHFPTWWPSAILNLKYFHIWSRDCHWVPNLLFCIKFHQNWIMRSAPRRPQLLNVQCAVAKQRLLPWQPHHGENVGTRWDATTQVSPKSVHWWVSYSMSNIFQYGGRPPSWILIIFIFGHVTAIEF